MAIHQRKFNEHLSPVSFFNTEETETVPPYGAMAIVGSMYRDATDDEWMCDVRRFTEEDSLKQNSAMVLFNTEFPVEPQRQGIGTLALPMSVLLGGPELSAPEEGGDAVPSGDPTEPQELDTVGPAPNSWELWRGGVTHTIRWIEIQGTQRYATLLPGPHGALVRFTEEIEEGSQWEPSSGNATLTLLDRNNEPQDAVGVNGDPLKIELWHAGINPVFGGIGQGKMTSGRWWIDLRYCDA